MRLVVPTTRHRCRGSEEEKISRIVGFPMTDCYNEHADFVKIFCKNNQTTRTFKSTFIPTLASTRVN
jgi:hypothetical protein